MPDAAFDAYLQQRIEAAFGLEEMTPEERAYWDAYDAFDEACRAIRERDRANFEAWLKAAPAAVTAHMHATGELPEDMRIIWSEPDA